ncbi:MAG: hypothetical protein QOC80_1376 [Frankiaceae bacterium]|nr:hypothetical protein [Frankiaceae bacterium]
MSRKTTTRSRWGAAVLATVLVSGFAVAGGTAPALADTAPAAGLPVTAGAEVLPTTQVDGVVWSQKVIGNIVYAGGKFTRARPPGAAPGVSTVVRNNLLAYDVTTGALVTSFAPDLNGQVLTVTASPDGRVLYVGGDFTVANGQARYRAAAYDTATGALLSTFKPTLDYTVKSIVATASTVYLGGSFSTANGVARKKLAAFRASDGGLLGWAPSADNAVNAMVMVPDGSRLVVGGSFLNLNATAAYGLGALNASTGATLPYAANASIRNYGAHAAILSLTTDGTNVYGTGYVFGGTGNLEGTFATEPNGGAIRWVEDCHGDTYSNYSSGGAVYVVGHSHSCDTVPGGFKQTDPWTFQRGLAFTSNARGTLTATPYTNYKNWAGTAAPQMLHWYPEISAGTFTGQNQGAWSVAGNGRYVVLGGEFPTVNGSPQQGLVRMALPSTQAPKAGPVMTGARFVPQVSQPASGQVRLNWQANYDRDNASLAYRLVRDGNTAAPIYSTTVSSSPFVRPDMTFTDTGQAPGSTHTYRLYATDPNGNQAASDTFSVTVGTEPAYARTVKADGASPYWRFNEPTPGTTAFDYSGTQFGTLTNGAAPGLSGGVTNDPSGKAVLFNGVAGAVNARNSRAGTNSFSVEAWFNTTTVKGGKLVGFGNAATGNSTNYDRHIYMDNAGHLVFGAYNGAVRSIASAGTFNNGAWHHVVGRIGPAGMALFVDGLVVAENKSVTAAQAYTGYWRVGGDSLAAWPNRPTSDYFNGKIDDVAIYPTPLTGAQVVNHFHASGR